MGKLKYIIYYIHIPIYIYQTPTLVFYILKRTYKFKKNVKSERVFAVIFL